ncbi:MAG: DUF2585 domain-containing protein [Pseudomonadota bacterium]
MSNNKFQPPANPRANDIYYHLAFAAFLIVGAAVVLYAMGRVPVCTCGTIKFWYGNPNGAENSQHLTDWYTFSHIIHGFIFYFLFWLAAARAPKTARFTAAVALECFWELIENTPLVINRYREATISLGYNGDSILNSCSDIAAMALGFFIASRVPIKLTIFLGLLFELTTGYLIRDNLTLNVLMLLHPMEAVKNWQGGL